jgi:starch phosphorylase
MYYERREQTPREWVRRMKQSLRYITPHFDCRRMVREYMAELYEPAHRQHLRMQAADYALARDKAAWNAKVRAVWDRVRFVESAAASPGATLFSGSAVAVRAAIDLAGLKPEDVRVEVVLGRVDSSGHLEETEVLLLPSLGLQGTVATFGSDILPERTGRLGYALRVSPNHFDDPLTRPCSNLLKWSSVG